MSPPWVSPPPMRTARTSYTLPPFAFLVVRETARRSSRARGLLASNCDVMRAALVLGALQPPPFLAYAAVEWARRVRAEGGKPRCVSLPLGAPELRAIAVLRNFFIDSSAALSWAVVAWADAVPAYLLLSREEQDALVSALPAIPPPSRWREPRGRRHADGSRGLTPAALTRPPRR